MLLGSELNSQVQSIRSKLDTFKVDNLAWAAYYSERMLEHEWMDSLLDNRSATMRHFNYFYSQGYLHEIYIPGYEKSPLAEEIMRKHGEHASNRITRRTLPKYQEGMTIMQGLDMSYLDIYNRMKGIVMNESLHGPIMRNRFACQVYQRTQFNPLGFHRRFSFFFV